MGCDWGIRVWSAVALLAIVLGWGCDGELSPQENPKVPVENARGVEPAADGGGAPDAASAPDLAREPVNADQRPSPPPEASCPKPPEEPLGNPPKRGSTTNLPLKATSPKSLLELLSPGATAAPMPMLWHVHSREPCKQGKLLVLMGIGEPRQGLPHRGKDRLRTQRDPWSVAFPGTFHGRQLRVVAKGAMLRFVAGLELLFESLTLNGSFSKDGSTLEQAQFVGILDPAWVLQKYGLDICALSSKFCFKDEQGRLRVRLEGSQKGISNPLPFSVFVPQPPSGSRELRLYFTEPVRAKDVSLEWSICRGSRAPARPCEASEGAILTPTQMPAVFKLDGAGKSATLSPQALRSKSIYKLSYHAKNAAGVSFSSFLVLRQP